jgi:LPS export ABC transporter protein LptC
MAAASPSLTISAPGTSANAPARAASTRPVVMDAATRAKSFSKARRHTAFVKLMRLALPVMSAVLVVGYGLAAKTKFKTENGVFEPGEWEVDTKNLTMKNPKYDGFGKDGSKYHIESVTAQQDLKRAGPVLLNEIDGIFTQVNDSKIKIKAARGAYDQKADTLELQDKITIRGDDGMAVDLTQATISIKEHKIVSSQPVQIQMAAGQINGQNMVLLQAQREVFFDGGVTASLRPEPKAAKDPAIQAAATTKSGPSLMGNADAPVDISSKSLKVDDNAKVATFSTGVVAKQGAATLETNELEAFYDGQPIAAAGSATAAQPEANKGQLKRLVSKGEVVLTQGADRVTSNSAEFDAVTEKAVLTGNVVMVSAERRASSDRADLDTKTEAAVLTGNVVISSGTDQQAKSDRADLNNKAETVLLTGNVIVDQGRNRLQGRRLAADRKAGNMTLSAPAEPGVSAGRISARFYQAEATPGKPAAKKTIDAAPTPGGGMSFRTDPSAPIDLTSELLNVVDKNHTATFSGAVHAVQGEFTIKTPELVATYSGQAALAGAPKTASGAPVPPTAGAQLQKIRANGKVEVTSSNDQSAIGDWAEFDVKGNKVVIGASFGKHVELKHGKTVLSGEKVIIDMITGLTVVENTVKPTIATVAAPQNPRFVPGQLPDLITDQAAKAKAVVPAFGGNSAACPPGRQCLKAFPQDGNAPAPGAKKTGALPWATEPAKPAP